MVEHVTDEWHKMSDDGLRRVLDSECQACLDDEEAVQQEFAAWLAEATVDMPEPKWYVGGREVADEDYCQHGDLICEECEVR